MRIMRMGRGGGERKNFILLTVKEDFHEDEEEVEESAGTDFLHSAHTRACLSRNGLTCCG